jgi:soluble lytic murein transglycosylase-like protein
MAPRSLRPLLGGMMLGATLWLGAQVPAMAQRADEQTAMSLPRPATSGAVPGLPQVLAPSDAARLRRVFELQAKGELNAAARETERLDDRRLMGHVLADRYQRPAGEPSAGQLQLWLTHYADLPDAPAIHALLLARLPRGAAAPAPPPEPEPLPAEAELAPEELDPAAPVQGRSQSLDRQVRERGRNGDLAGGITLIQRAKLSVPYTARLKTELAQALFAAGHDDAAYRAAAEVARGKDSRAQAAFLAGLAAWSQGRYEAALPFFERAARAESSPAQRAAAAFWTARAAVRSQRPQLYVSWMLQAAQEPRTFYGLLARRALGLPSGFAWQQDLAGEAEGAAVAEVAGGWRALALLQIGQNARAEAELRQLWGQARSNPGLIQAMLVVANQAGLSGLAAQLAAASQGADGRPRDFARFPVPQLIPQGGFRVDPALLYAVALKESNFDSRVISPAGARGLLQLMPATASYIANDPSLRGAGVHRLHDPALSLELGQRYMHVLARLEVVDGNLLRLLAAYNAGSGNPGRWLPAASRHEDPLLFVESIPIDETRHFVQRVMAYSWIYASRLGLPAPSLDQLAAGNYPRFAQPDEVTAMLRDRSRRLH